MRDGRPRYVTALGTTNAAGGWRERKATGGVLIDIESDEIVLDGLAMPHSPRWHDGRLWLLNSGAGELLLVGSAERPVRRRLPFARLFARAVFLRSVCAGGAVEDSRAAHFRRIARPAALRKPAVRRGGGGCSQRPEVGFFEFTGGCEEIYDVQFLPGVLRPMILNLEKPAARQAMTNPDSCFWLRPSSEIREPAPVASGHAIGEVSSALAGG